MSDLGFRVQNDKQRGADIILPASVLRLLKVYWGKWRKATG